MKRKGNLILPGDKGFNDDLHKKLPWNSMLDPFGIEAERDIKLEIHGFFLKDNRRDPPMAIMRNAEYPLTTGVKPVMADEPIFFESAKEALMRRDSMHLSTAEEKKIELVALCPDPGMGSPMPNVLHADSEADLRKF
jgi:hypothetical protein